MKWRAEETNTHEEEGGQRKKTVITKARGKKTMKKTRKRGPSKNRMRSESERR